MNIIKFLLGYERRSANCYEQINELTDRQMQNKVFDIFVIYLLDLKKTLYYYIILLMTLILFFLPQILRCYISQGIKSWYPNSIIHYLKYKGIKAWYSHPIFPIIHFLKFEDFKVWYPHSIILFLKYEGIKAFVASLYHPLPEVRVYIKLVHSIYHPLPKKRVTKAGTLTLSSTT